KRSDEVPFDFSAQSCACAEMTSNLVILRESFRIVFSGRGAHSRFVDKALGRGIDSTSFAASWGEYVKRALLPCAFMPRQRNLIIDRLLVIGEQILRPEHAFEVEKTAEKVGLTAH